MSLHLGKTPKYSYILEKPQLLIEELLSQIKKINKAFNKINPNLDKSEAEQCTNFILGGMEHISFELGDKIGELIRDYKQLLKWHLNKHQSSLFDNILNQKHEIPDRKDEEEIMVSDTGSSKFEIFNDQGKEEEKDVAKESRELRYQRTDDEDEESEMEFEEINPNFQEVEESREGNLDDKGAKMEYDSEPKSQNLMDSLNKISEQLKKINSRNPEELEYEDSK